MSAIPPISKLQAGIHTHDIAMRRSAEMAERATGTAPTRDTHSGGFAERIGQSLEAVANAQNEAAQMRQDYELGREQDLTKVMVSQQISSLGFDLTLNVRNKALTAYKDIMNMPV